MRLLLPLHALLWITVAAFATERPNIIYIMADDLGYADLGCYGQKQIKTPHIDQLAREGTRFTQFYSGSTVCAPARSCLMTGLHTGHTRVRGNKDPRGGRVPLRDEDITVAEVLKQAGYATGIVGKWGLGEPETTGIPNRQGFDFWFGYLNQNHAHSYYPLYLWKNQQQYPLPGNVDGKRQDYSHHFMTREALGFIEQNRSRPFFLYLAYTIPHAAYEIPSIEPYMDREWPDKNKTYAAMVTLLDSDIGRIMRLLRDLQLDRRTVVFFCSDNGAAFVDDVFNSSGPLRGKKRDMYEGGIRVPMIARWPDRVPAGVTSDQVWAMWDFLPTAAELASVHPPKHIDGISMVNALTGKLQTNHDFLYWEFFQKNRMLQAVRMGQWKAVRPSSETIELYDLETDIGETRDVSDQHPDIMARIHTYLKTGRTESEIWRAP